MNTDAVMIDKKYTVRDVILRGFRCPMDDGDQVAVFDSENNFVVLEVQNGLAKKVVKGPFAPRQN